MGEARPVMMGERMSVQKPGSARASGPTVAETIAADRVAPPAPLLESDYAFLGDVDIDCERYTSEAFARREDEQLWRRCWHWACSEEYLPDVGDNYVHNIGPCSVIVVRDSADSIKAFVNSCTHRGTRLIDGEGSGYSMQSSAWGQLTSNVQRQYTIDFDSPAAAHTGATLMPGASGPEGE